MKQEDPEINILLDQAGEFYSSLLRGETMLADATCFEISSNSIQLQRRTKMNLPKHQRYEHYG
ncbi:hypothetical protein DPMN_105352 [Dreissena polymorpha]|uniref:Uncharacterized protein n=1 Tax=Dreissena polymorpha TaxID=45954 RepID=A0A9D4HEK7_DREPO|nr:hypothetical protein DPMN_105352 [Dreissena polymorpha]